MLINITKIQKAEQITYAIVKGQKEQWDKL